MPRKKLMLILVLFIAVISTKAQEVVSSGGDLTEINPKTMQSKKYENLYFAGEFVRKKYYICL